MAKEFRGDYCDHALDSYKACFDNAFDKAFYDIAITLGENHVLLLCPQCGASLEGNVLSHCNGKLDARKQEAGEASCP
jgi:predicted RNA-binding Zn-ribbon protein involved in translation (DUF1610 family)